MGFVSVQLNYSGFKKVTLFLKILHFARLPLQTLIIRGEMTSEEFLTEKKAHRLLLVDFYATWCEPCKMLDVILKEVKENLTDQVTILKIDLDESDELKKDFDIMSVPTLMLFNNGELSWRMAGFMMTHDLTEKIREFI